MKYEKNIVPVIEANYDNFTASEKRVADFFINNREELDFSAKQIAGLLYTSEACLSRFAKKCGFDGYRKFVYRYQEIFEDGDKNALVGQGTRHILNAYQDILTKAYSLIDEEQMSRAAGMLAGAKRIFVYGKGSSGIAGEELKMRFMRLGIDIECITDTHMMKMNSAIIRPGDLAVGITVSGLTYEVVRALAIGHKKGAGTIMISSKRKEEWITFCDEVVLLATKENLDFGNLISPQFPVLVVSDVLYANVLEYDRRKKERLHRITLTELGRGEDRKHINKDS